MVKNIVINNVNDFCQLFGFEPSNRLLGVFDLSNASVWQNNYILKYNVYTVFLKKIKCGDIRYGKKEYEYNNGTVLSFAPGQSIEVNIPDNTNPTSIGLMFHPDLISGTQLWSKMNHFSYFSYSSSEALNLSKEEHDIFINLLRNIELEVTNLKDSHTNNLILQNIELLLEYCLRFYERQFITNFEKDDYIGIKFNKLLNDFYIDNKSVNYELPTVKYFSDIICISKNYFGDYIKKTTGKTVMEHIQNKILEIAKYQLLHSNKTISQIAIDLGFKYPQHFSRFFKNYIGCSPYKYKSENKL